MPDGQITGGVTVARPAVALDFTDGDTLKRFTVTDSFVNQYTHIVCSVRRADIADVDDPGWIYTPNVVTVTTGSFDVLVSAVPGDTIPGVNEFPNETVTLLYQIQ